MVWRSKINGAVLARSSQPNVGLLAWRLNEDELLLKSIGDCCSSSSSSSANSSNLNHHSSISSTTANSFNSTINNNTNGVNITSNSSSSTTNNATNSINNISNSESGNLNGNANTNGNNSSSNLANMNKNAQSVQTTTDQFTQGLINFCLFIFLGGKIFSRNLKFQLKQENFKKKDLFEKIKSNKKLKYKDGISSCLESKFF